MLNDLLCDMANEQRTTRTRMSVEECERTTFLRLAYLAELSPAYPGQRAFAYKHENLLRWFDIIRVVSRAYVHYVWSEHHLEKDLKFYIYIFTKIVVKNIIVGVNYML